MAIPAIAGAAKTIGLALVTEAKYLWGVEDQFRSLHRDLLCMQQFLQDVDANPNLLRQEGQLRILSHEMQALAFRVEDVIDTYLVDVRSKNYNKNFLKKVVGLASHSYPMHMQRKEIEAVQQEIKVAVTRSENFRASISDTGQLQGDSVGSSYSQPVGENYIHLDEEFVVGIGDEITRLVKLLTNPRGDIRVLGIVGTVGAGKTTLASQIYQHTEIQCSFSHRAFVSISQQWSRLDLLNRISKEILGRSNISSSERELVRDLHEFMQDKRCLVVLDGIWKKETWDDICPIFPSTQGLKVILTTRVGEVPLYADKKCVLHEPQMLTNEQMWALFSKGAVKGRQGIENNAKFENLAKLMLQKCHGLPLAVVTLAGILNTKKDLYEWERVSVAFSSKILEGKGSPTYGDVEEMFELSYLELPSHLKPLFLYFAFMPEGYLYTSHMLVGLWIAEGFVANDQTGRCETLEEKAMQFMSELAQRYIIQLRRENIVDNEEYLYIHALMREFCMKKARECQFLECISSARSYGKQPNKPRRISVFSRDHCLEENNYLRTIVYNGWSDGVIGKLESIHKNFKLLRVLKISKCANETLPKEIGNLIHLTYLSIMDTQITELPESVRNLRNLTSLQFIPLPGRITRTPDDLVGSMENLRVLLLFGSTNLKRLGINSERHKKLHTFNCSSGKWLMKDLPTMKEVLIIKEIEEIEEMEGIHESLGFLKGSLQIFKCAFNGKAVSKKLKFDTEKLMDSQLLHTIYLFGRLVNNCTIQFPANLVKLHISDSEIEEGVDLMGVLGHLSKLKYLIIQCNAYLGTELHCKDASFPQLEVLKLENLDSLEEWGVEGGAMNRLNYLSISGCPKLKGLPQRIRFITTLKELGISAMPQEFCWRLGLKKDENGRVVRTRGQDSNIIQHILSVKLDSILIMLQVHPWPYRLFWLL